MSEYDVPRRSSGSWEYSRWDHDILCFTQHLGAWTLNLALHHKVEQALSREAKNSGAESHVVLVDQVVAFHCCSLATFSIQVCVHALFRSVQPVGHEHHVAHPITRTSHGSVASPAVRAGCRPQTTGGSEASLVLTSPSSVLALANSGNNAHTCNTERPTLVCAAACSEADYVGTFGTTLFHGHRVFPQKAEQTHCHLDGDPPWRPRKAAFSSNQAIVFLPSQNVPAVQLSSARGKTGPFHNWKRFSWLFGPWAVSYRPSFIRHGGARWAAKHEHGHFNPAQPISVHLNATPHPPPARPSINRQLWMLVSLLPHTHPAHSTNEAQPSRAHIQSLKQCAQMHFRQHPPPSPTHPRRCLFFICALRLIEGVDATRCTPLGR